MSGPDRRIHAGSLNWVIVRYDRAGKWYIEWSVETVGLGLRTPGMRDVFPNLKNRAPLTVREAALLAAHHSDDIRTGLIGGNDFDRKVRAALAAKREAL